MTKEEQELLMQRVTADLKNALGKRLTSHGHMGTGNASRMTNGYNITNSTTFGEIVINVPYATSFNYGFQTHPTSRLLKEDYQIIEKEIKKSLRVTLNSMGKEVVVK